MKCLKKDQFHQSSERFSTRKLFGFCKNHSNAHSIVRITQFLRKAIEKRYVACLFIGLKKIFLMLSIATATASLISMQKNIIFVVFRGVTVNLL